MKKLALLGLLPLLAVGAVVAQPDPKVVICHKTGSATNPTVTIEVSGNAVDAHVKNHGDTLGACPDNPTVVPDPATPDVVPDTTQPVVDTNVTDTPRSEGK